MEEQIMTQTIPVSQAKPKFGELINEVYKRKVRIITIPFPTKQELARRQALVNRILTNAEKRIIAPLITADLVHQARKEREKAHERWSR